MRLSRVGRDYTYGEAHTWISELMKETGSHLYAEMVGLSLAGSQAELATIWHAQAQLNWNRDPKVSPDPIHLPGPWPDQSPNADVTPERRAELEARLNAVSAFPT